MHDDGECVERGKGRLAQQTLQRHFLFKATEGMAARQLLLKISPSVRCWSRVNQYCANCCHLRVNKMHFLN